MPLRWSSMYDTKLTSQIIYLPLAYMMLIVYLMYNSKLKVCFISGSAFDCYFLKRATEYILEIIY